MTGSKKSGYELSKFRIVSFHYCHIAKFPYYYPSWNPQCPSIMIPFYFLFTTPE